MNPNTLHTDWFPADTDDYIRAAIARLNGERMNITDEMIERAFEALYPMVEAHPDMTPDHYQRHVYGLARSALTAALGDVEPLEDGLREVMGEGWTVRQLWPTPKQWHAHVSRVVERGRLDWQNQFGEGSGPTIDAAIRAAVANAKDGER